MITHSEIMASVLRGSHTRWMSVESWRGSTLLAAAVPAATGMENADRGLHVPERVELTVPRVVDGVDWTPTGVDSPLGAYGQRLTVKLGVGVAHGEVEWVQRGVFLIRSCVPDEEDGDTLVVEAVNLLELIREATLLTPFQPTGTIVSTVRALVEPALTVLVSSSLADRSVPAGINIDEDRLQGLFDVLKAWPAEPVVNPAGVLEVRPIDTGTAAAVLELTDVGDDEGTVINVVGRATRDGIFNAVVARGTAADGGQVMGTAYVTSGPGAYGGPFSPLPVPKYIESQLLTTVAEASAAARAEADVIGRTSSTEYDVLMVPHPALQTGDVVELTSARLGLSAVRCSVEALQLPYHPDGGRASARMRSLAS